MWRWQSSERYSKDFPAEVSVVEVGWVEPAGCGKDALVEGVGEYPEEALICSRLSEPSSFVLLNKISKFSMDCGGDCCCQLLLVGKTHHTRFGLVNIWLQMRVVTPIHHLLGGSLLLERARQQRPEDCIGSTFNQVGMGLCGSAVRAVVRGHNPEEIQWRCVLHWTQCCSLTLSVGQQRTF